VGGIGKAIGSVGSAAGGGCFIASSGAGASPASLLTLLSLGALGAFVAIKRAGGR
jgi:hypothetical protein